MNQEINKLKSIIQAREDEHSIIEILKDYNTEIDIEGGTPLNHAINYDRNLVVEYLIHNGANINALYDGHYSPLMSAVDSNNIDMVKLLLENGADINLVDKHGNGALWKAVFNNNLEIVKLLVNAAADPFKEIKDGWNIYDGAKHIGVDEIVDFFDTLKK
jgi:ankyrin repeat protein